jgi:hypothetical protein
MAGLGDGGSNRAKMHCTVCDCTREPDPAKQFCGSCGHPVADHVAEVEPVEPNRVGPTAPPEVEGPSKVPAPPQEALPGPRLEGWAVPVFLFGFVAGLIGHARLKRENPERASHILKWGFIWSALSLVAYPLLLAALLIPGLHSTDSTALPPSAGIDSGVTAEATETQALASPSAELGDPVASFDGTATTQDEYSASIAILVYKLARAGSLPSLPSTSRRVLAACTANAETDAVIPISFSIRNTTADFSSALGVRFTEAANGSGRVLEGDMQYSDGARCLGSNSATPELGLIDIVWKTPIRAGFSADSDAYLVVHNYFAPSHPDGDSRLLSSIELQPVLQLGPDASEFVTPTDFEGNELIVTLAAAARPAPQIRRWGGQGLGHSGLRRGHRPAPQAVRAH